MSIWATSVSLPPGATVGGKTEAEIGAEIQAALAAGDEGKLESIMDSLHNAGHSGSFNASQPLLDVLGRSEYTGIVPDHAATSPAATIQYAAENQMLNTGETKAVLEGGAQSQGEATQMAPLYADAVEQPVQLPRILPSQTYYGGARTSPIGGTQRGFLNQPTGRYPVAPMGYPSGVSYPAAQDAAQGWAGEMGFNINPRGGLLLRPWEAASWDLSGIDPALWDAPFARGGFLGGGGYPGGVPGGVPGGYPGTIPGPINTGGTTGTTTTDTSGNQWVMSPGGQWYPADSDYGQGLLGNSRLFYDQHYDSSGAYVGAEGTSYDDQGFEIDRQGRRTGGYINDSLGIGNKILGWMGADPAEVQRTRAIMADADMDVARDVGRATAIKYGTGGYQGTGVNAQPSGLLATNASSVPWGASAWDSVSDPYVNAYINDPSTGYDVSTGPTYAQRMAGIRNAQMVDARTRAEQSALAEQKAYEDAQMARSITAKGLYDPMDDYQDEMARQALTSYSMGPNYGLLSGSARIGAGGVSDINAQINAAMAPQPTPAPLSISPQVAMPAVSNVPAGPTIAAQAAAARLDQQMADAVMRENAVRAATRDEARNGGGGDRSAGRGSFGGMDAGYAGPR